jgi:sulfotransferase famil protein
MKKSIIMTLSAFFLLNFSNQLHPAQNSIQPTSKPSSRKNDNKKFPLKPNENQFFIFYHIPKTAGQSICSLLKHQFAKEITCPDEYYYQVEERSIEDLRKFKYFRGHFFYNSNLLELKKSKKIVFLREPIHRVLSEQRFYEAHLPLGPNALLVLKKTHFLPEGLPINTVSNQQCLFLSSLDRNDPSITSEMHLASAKKNLSKEFFFIGITEYLEESIHALYKLMGWQIPETIPRLNTTDRIKLKDIDTQVIEGIKQRNSHDIELYEFAKDLFESKYLNR